MGLTFLIFTAEVCEFNHVSFSFTHEFYSPTIIAASLTSTLQIPNIPPEFPAPPNLVLDLEHTLVCSSWDRKYGWRPAKRPGVDKFLATLNQYYETVIFTPSIDGVAQPVIDSLDPKGYTMHRLFRDASHYHDGVHCKDLSWLNRDVSKIVALDDDPKALGFQPDNLISVKPYDDPEDREDRTLKRITPLLVELSREGHSDIPAALRQFQSKDADEIADEFEARVANIRERRNQSMRRGLGALATRDRSLPAPEMTPMKGDAFDEKNTGLTSKDLVGSAPPESAVDEASSGAVGRLMKRQKLNEEQNRAKFVLWNKGMAQKAE